MSSPVIPPPIEALRHCPFSFYPAILNIEHNQWQYRKATWSDVLVVNARTGLEISIARRFLGEISSIEDPVVIVGLLKELEYREGAVLPYQRRVIEMPIAVGARPATPPAPVQRTGPAPVVGIRLEAKSESHIFRFVGGALVLGIVAAYVVVNFYRESMLRPRVSYSAKERLFFNLSARDSYDSVVRKLGPPAGDHWQEAGGVRYRALWYPDRAWTVVLRGTNGQEPVYIGTLDADWNPIHSVEPSLLRGLRRLTQ
jgi:hypothetical protein